MSTVAGISRNVPKYSIGRTFVDEVLYVIKGDNLDEEVFDIAFGSVVDALSGLYGRSGGGRWAKG